MLLCLIVLSCFGKGVGEGPLANLSAKGRPEKGVLAEAMLVKSLKMVVKPLMLKSIAKEKVMPM
jgi:hypothetical protein